MGVVGQVKEVVFPEHKLGSEFLLSVPGNGKSQDSIKLGSPEMLNSFE